MDTHRLDRNRLTMHPLSSRTNRADIERDHTKPGAEPRVLKDGEERVFAELILRVRAAREKGAPVVIAFGAHTIKNGLAPVLIELMEGGWLSHLATNGAGIIHDWEFAFAGQSSEHVAPNVADGTFGNWEETGLFINLAILVGAYEGRGYGESVGRMIEEESLDIPSEDALKDAAHAEVDNDSERAAAAIDLLGQVRAFSLPAGRMDVAHAWKPFSAQAAAYRLGLPLTGHPMIGHDIIYNHPMNHGAAIGRTALRDFLLFARTISEIDGGVYLSIGSAVMSPMIFEKSMSMAQNLAAQEGRRVANHFITVVDLAESKWDWSRGEPLEDDPAYYLRFNKSFSRMGGTLRYLQMDNRDFLLHLAQNL